jgi:hypothetical protein
MTRNGEVGRVQGSCVQRGRDECAITARGSELLQIRKTARQLPRDRR